MSLKKFFEKIESYEIAVRTNVTSGMRSFLHALENEPAVGKLFQLAKERANALQILRRVREVAEFRVDPRYENSFDTALTAYLRVLLATHPELARIGASAVANAQNCWWASKVAQEVLADLTIRSGHETSQTAEVVTNQSVRTTFTCPDSGESYVIATCPASVSVKSIVRVVIGFPCTGDAAKLVEEPWPEAPIQLLSDHSVTVSVM